jgi:hypothetical protein
MLRTRLQKRRESRIQNPADAPNLLDPLAISDSGDNQSNGGGSLLGSSNTLSMPSPVMNNRSLMRKGTQR